ncbi:MAG: SEC-C domain-containing protein [Acidimicrobiales bacterium]
MQKQGRNELCHCGSGKKAKYCCGSWRGPSPEALDRAFIAAASRDSRPERLELSLSGLTEQYLDELYLLPMNFPELTVTLPTLIDLELDKLLKSCATRDTQGVDAALRQAASRYQSVPERARLAREVVRLRDEGRVDRHLAALALFDLGRPEPSALVEAATLQAALVRSGVSRTSTGLLVSS